MRFTNGVVRRWVKGDLPPPPSKKNLPQTKNKNRRLRYFIFLIYCNA